MPIPPSKPRLNVPMVARLRQCAADTSSTWDGAINIYPPEARQLVALIDATPSERVTPERVRTDDGCYRVGGPAAGGSITWNPARRVVTAAHPGAVWLHECWPDAAELLTELLTHGGEEPVWAQLEHIHTAVTKLAAP